jgi:hypothetical protein
LYWNGTTPNVLLGDVNIVRHVLFDRTGLYPKNLMNPHLCRLLGKGLVLTDGDDWKRHRKVVHPAFDMDKLKVTYSQRHTRVFKINSSISSLHRTDGRVVLFFRLLSLFRCLNV